MNDKRTRAPRLILAFVAALMAAHGADVSPSEFKARRAELMRRFPNGIVLLHARSDFISQTAWYQPSFHEDPSFYYFFGGGTNLSSILAVDGAKRETWLFAPTKLSGAAVPRPARSSASSMPHLGKSLCHGSSGALPPIRDLLYT